MQLSGLNYSHACWRSGLFSLQRLPCGPRFVWHLQSDFCAIFILTVFLCRRRIDVSPRAFKKHSQLFEAMKSSEEDAYKVTEHSAV